MSDAFFVVVELFSKNGSGRVFVSRVIIGTMSEFGIIEKREFPVKRQDSIVGYPRAIWESTSEVVLRDPWKEF